MVIPAHLGLQRTARCGPSRLHDQFVVDIKHASIFPTFEQIAQPPHGAQTAADNHSIELLQIKSRHVVARSLYKVYRLTPKAQLGGRSIADAYVQREVTVQRDSFARQNEPSNERAALGI